MDLPIHRQPPTINAILQPPGNAARPHQPAAVSQGAAVSEVEDAEEHVLRGERLQRSAGEKREQVVYEDRCLAYREDPDRSDVDGRVLLRAGEYAA